MAETARKNTRLECIEGWETTYQVLIAVPYLLGAIVFYSIGVVLHIIGGLFAIVFGICTVLAVLFDVVIFFWTTGGMYLTSLAWDAIIGSFTLYGMTTAYWKFGGGISDAVWGNCELD